MRLVNGLWPAIAGSVIVFGAEVAGPLTVAGMAFQNPTLLPWRNVIDNVMLPLEVVEPRHRQLRRQRAMHEAKARGLPALVGLGGFEKKFPWQVSGGMRQRASLCRALIHDPALPILVIWFGIGTVPAIITAFLISFFPIVVNVATGIATVEPELRDVLRALGRGTGTSSARSACRVRCRVSSRRSRSPSRSPAWAASSPRRWPPTKASAT